jgi:hypothetical protein
MGTTIVISSPWQLAPFGIIVLGFVLAGIGMFRFISRGASDPNGPSAQMVRTAAQRQAQVDKVFLILFDPKDPLDARLILGGMTMFILGMVAMIVVSNI